MPRRAAAAVFGGLLAAGCAAGPPLPSGWAGRDLSAAGRVLASAAPTGQPQGPVLTVVIEGDGRAHDRAGRPTRDPTPSDPLGLRLAAAWPEGPVAWLARPCQYTRRADPACRPEDWTSDRFGPEALAALDAAVDALKQGAGATQVRLVGWSGGGVMAAALARRRADAVGLATFAAPLDVGAWTRAMRLSPLRLAPEAADDPLPRRVAQVHFLGARDKVAPLAVALPAARTAAGETGRIETVDESHDCCWPGHVRDAAATLAGPTPSSR